MIDRLALSQIEKSLNRQAATAIIGPRQVGKTTIAYNIAEQKDAIYLDLEDREDRIKLTSPKLFFDQFQEKLIILDEIHRMPGIFDELRGAIDRGRRNNNKFSRFLILGSASIDLLKQSSESLAGRISYIDLNPINVKEFAHDLSQQEQLWLRGGFPDSLLANDNEDSIEIRKDFIKTYIERDVPMFGANIPSTTMHRFWGMLAYEQGGIVNYSKLAKSLEVSHTSISRYIDLLSDLLLVRKLQPYHANIGKRLVKSPKIYIRDTGILHALLGIKDLDRLMGHPTIGMSWEGFIIENIISLLPWNAQPFFYRTSGGAEIDLVIEHSDGRLWAIEIKRSTAAKPSKGFHQAYKDLNPQRAFVIHAGDHSNMIDENIESVGIREFCNNIDKYLKYQHSD